MRAHDCEASWPFGPFRVVLPEQPAGRGTEPTLEELEHRLLAAYGTDVGVHRPSWITRFSDMSRQAAAYRAFRDTMAQLLGMDEARRSIAGMMSALDVRYDLGEGHPLLGRRMPDLDLVTADGPTRVFELLHDARPVLLDLTGTGCDLSAGGGRIRLVQARHDGVVELPVIGEISAPAAVAIRPDGHVAWAGDLTDPELPRSLERWFGAPTPLRAG